MAAQPEITNMALFCDFENIALGVRDAKYSQFDIRKVLERLLLKGSIVVKKAYCDWDRYKEFKGPMHQASFELIEIPHVRMSGKNSADIRIVVGVGVKKSTSDLLVAACDEFIYYDDLVREQKARKPAVRPKPEGKKPAAAAAPSASNAPQSAGSDKQQEAFDLVLDTLEALVDERGEDDTIWGSMVKQALKRRKPGFNESYYGFRSFNQLLEEARSRGLLDLERDEKSGGYVVREVL